RDSLTFLPEDFSVHTEKGKELEVYDVELETDPKRVAVYEGKSEIVTIVTQVKEDQNVLVGINKEISKEEKDELEDGTEDGETEEKEEKEEDGENKEKEEKEEDGEDKKKDKKEEKKDKKGKGKKGDKEEDENELTKYLTTEGVYTLVEFNVEDNTEERDLEELNKQGSEEGEGKEKDNMYEIEGENEKEKNDETEEKEEKEESKNKEE